MAVVVAWQSEQWRSPFRAAQDHNTSGRRALKLCQERLPWFT
ncbi:hypothetical protein AB0L35_19465 [Streptomyces sp. NPDC052309]